MVAHPVTFHKVAHPAFSIASPLFSHHKSAITISHRNPLITTNLKCERPDKLVASASVKTVDSDFSQWASSVGITMPSLHLTNFNTTKIRGLAASSPITERSTVITVPSTSALQVTSAADEKPPEIFSISRSDWRQLPWFVRLGLMVVAARRDTEDRLHGWANRLPTDVDVPYRWSDAEIAELQSERLAKLIKKQRRIYDDYFKRVCQMLPRDVSLSKSEFLSGIDCVRSRAFSGPLEAAPFRQRLQLSLFIVANTFGWPLLNVLSWENALNGKPWFYVLPSALYSLFYDQF